MDPRRRDASHTRFLITRAARRHFALDGYDRATVRAIAQDAGVSANLITRYFGGKKGLFVAATQVDLRIIDALPGPRSTLGRRIARHVMTRWESAPGEDPLLIMLRAAVNDRFAAAHMADFFRTQATEPMTAHLAVDDGRERAAAVSALIMGTVVQRYVLRMGPVATADVDGVTEWLAHALQQMLIGRPFAALINGGEAV